MKTLCPICSDILLRHLCKSRILWFCLRCHQEMPNFDLANFPAIPEKCPIYSDRRNLYDRQKDWKQNLDIFQLTKYKSLTIKFILNEDKKRLEVVSFILNQINIILLNTFNERENYLIDRESKESQIETQKSSTSTLEKVSFLQDSETILLCICQAILIADRSILTNINLPGFKINLTEFKLPVEQSCLIDLIKTSVIEFIYSITLDSSQSLNNFVSEVASYFEMAIILINQLPQS